MGDRVIIKLARGEQIMELAKFLLQEEYCKSFQIEQETYLCQGHPQFDKKTPKKSKNKLEKEGKWKGDDWRPEGWSGDRKPFKSSVSKSNTVPKKTNHKWKKSIKKSEL